MNTTEAQITAWLDAGRGPYTSEQLNAAFKELDFSKMQHWKCAISMWVSVDKVDILSYAVPWHCGGPAPEFSQTNDKGMVWMTHPGYFECIGS